MFFLMIFACISEKENLTDEHLTMNKKEALLSVNQTEVDNCDSNYSGVCLPKNSPDLDCRDIRVKNFIVTGYDHHRLDRDRDGIACESH